MSETHEARPRGGRPAATVRCVLVLAVTLTALGGGCSDDGAAVDSGPDGRAADQLAGDRGPGDGAPPGQLSEVESFGDNPGQLKMFKYVPGAPSPAAPLVVVLHGCGQTAAAMASASGWSELAERLGFHVLYPEQRAANNPLGCFNWFAPADASPGGGEARSIEQMIDAMLAAHDIDGARVFVSGFSAGAAMAVALAAGYPERFAGGAIVAGVPAGCASDALSGQSCMAGADETPAAWAAAARALRPGYSGSYPRMVFFHGTLDAVVDDANLAELVEQWTALHGLDQTPESSETFRGHERQRHGVGQPAVESYHIAGLGHALPVDPGGDDDQGGEVGLHASDEDLWAAYYAAAFWGLVGG